MFDLEYDTKFGTHSDIPVCCIEAYITGDMPLTPIVNRAGRSWDYRPCWECYLRNRWVEIHHCSKGCKSFLKSIEMRKWKIQRTKSRREMKRSR